MPICPLNFSHSALFSSSMFQARLVHPFTAVRRIPCVRPSAGNFVTTGVRRIAAVIEIFWLDVTEPKWIVPTAVSRTSLEASRPPPPTSFWRITTLGRYLRSDSSIVSPIWKFLTWAETKCSESMHQCHWHTFLYSIFDFPMMKKHPTWSGTSWM